MDKLRPRKELEHLADEIDKKADIISADAAEMNRIASEAHDQARLYRLTAVYVVDENLSDTIKATTSYRDQLNSLAETSRRMTILSTPAVTTSGSAAVSEGYNVIQNQMRYSQSVGQVIDLSEATRAYDFYFEKYKIKSQVENYLHNLKFDQETYGKTVIQKFRSAWEFFSQSPMDLDQAIGCLIPLREAIQESVGELLRRRPVQGKVGQDKIINIGSHLGYDNLPPNTFTNLDNQYGPLIDGLSSAKGHDLSREKINELLWKGTLFLETLLSAIDPAKIR
jgi:hypothetical protein